MTDVFSLMDDGTDMLTDLPDHSWLVALDEDDIAALPCMDGVIDHHDVEVFVLDRLLRGVAALGEVPSELRPMLFSLVLQPGLDIRATHDRYAHATGWLLMGQVLREPARSRCLRHARECLAAG
jgi:hypothetical protein